MKAGFFRIWPVKTLLAITRTLPGREHILPTPFAVCIGILAGQRKGQVDSTETLLAVGSMKGPGAGELDFERFDKTLRQHSYSVFLAFPVSDNNFALESAHVIRVAIVVEKNEPMNPIGVAFLGSNTLMTRADRVSELVEAYLGSFVPANPGWRCVTH